MLRPVSGMLLVLSAVLALAGLGPAGGGRAHAQAACTAWLDGTPTDVYRSWRDPLVVDHGGDLVAHVLPPAGARSAEVTVFFGSVPVEQRTFRSGVVPWVATVPVGDYARVGAGLYRIEMRTSNGDCSVNAWVRLTANAPLTTMIGASAAVAVVVGGLAILGAWSAAWRARARGSGYVVAVLGGLVTGLGSCLLSQQYGLTPATWDWVATWTTPMVGLSTVTQGVMGRVGAARTPPGAETAPAAGASAPGLPGGPPRPPSSYPPVAMGPTKPPVSAQPGDPPRTAYALLLCEDAVVAGVPFELEVGLAPDAVPGVAGGQLRRPESSTGEYTLSIQVVADGFALAPGESWRNELEVTMAAPYPRLALHLVAPEPEGGVSAGAVQAFFAVDGQTMGMAVRAVAIVREAAALGRAERPQNRELVGLDVPTTETAADLTLRIQVAGPGGRLLWTLDSPHCDIRLPDAALEVDIGDAPDAFARHLVASMGAREGFPGLYEELIGQGRTIADQVPPLFWDVLAAVAWRARSEGRVPSLFLLSEEPYIPWELAVLDAPIDPDPAVPPILGAQVQVGRWVLGNRRPKLPPPIDLDIQAMAVIWGRYDQLPGWSRLEHAEDEAMSLARAYDARSIAAATGPMLDCLRGQPPAQLLHFAVHGIYDPGSIDNGLVLTDGFALLPSQVKARTLAASPFVFLNACQVGSANRVLGDYSGMAESFLYAGASAVVGPLWSIDDAVARDIALRFYRSAFEGIPVAEILRRERCAFVDSPETVSATCLAYLFFGHPAFTLRRSL